MHELGLVTHVVRIIEETAKTEKLKKVASVTLEIGEVSGIIPDYLEDCFSYFIRKSQLMQEAKLKIEMIPAVTYCEDCRKTYDTLKYAKKCPFCSSENTFLATGNEFNIKEIEAC